MNKNPWLLAQFDKKKVQAIAQVKRRHAARLAKKAAEAEGKTVEAVPKPKSKGKGKKATIEKTVEQSSETASQSNGKKAFATPVVKQPSDTASQQ